MQTVRKTDDTGNWSKDQDTPWGAGICNVCGARNWFDFFELKNVPTQDGVLWSTYEAAVNAPRGDISLSLCLSCGYIGNRLFQPALLRFVGYNISLEFSRTYQEFIRSLADRLIHQYSLHEKTVLEIGCGNGYFLKTICALGRNKGVGFDPSYSGVSPNAVALEELEFIKDYYSEAYGQYHGDLVCCRQVIDHLGNPKSFLKMVRDLIGDRSETVVYFEVPNAERTIMQFVPWNVGYEHGSWFTEKSLQTLFELCGFEVREVAPCNHDEYLGIEATVARSPLARGGAPSAPADGQNVEKLARLSDDFRETVEEWQSHLRRFERDGIRAVPWGAGARAIGFLSALNVADQMPFVVDINPGRIGKYLPVTGQKIVPPEFLVGYKPDIIVITNPTYATEIQQQSRAMGLNCEFRVL